MLTVGVVGPSALGEQTQKTVHSILPDNQDPKGWDNQLEEALMNSTGYNVSPSNDDKNLLPLDTWENVAYAPFVSNKNYKTNLTICYDEPWKKRTATEHADLVWNMSNRR